MVMSAVAVHVLQHCLMPTFVIEAVAHLGPHTVLSHIGVTLWVRVLITFSQARAVPKKTVSDLQW